MDVKTAQPLRDLAPGVAWNDAQRRSLVICIAGFFLPNLLAEFGAVPQLHQSFSFLAGCMWCSRFVFREHGSVHGVYHRKPAHGAALAVCTFTLPYLATSVLVSLKHPSNSAGLLQLCGPTGVMAIAAYAFLIWWHARESNVTTEGLLLKLLRTNMECPRRVRSK